ncbi:hypothetical protein CEE37_11190 [candidate division LCP-89 bacterium B3_LCP]|uniref:Uncharacterized protein n=1 Tax=candidate division LCP-89 bacterium B3_LCP TaxID=2012998 RepID=A0A532UY07_UNCL8|nr:MAG: hypothetical protein CEE37_11190 [candidate division LCP-89 bacterium B3_LCP]
MAKAQTFGEKVAKAQLKQQKTCPVCGAALSYVKVIDPVQLPGGQFRFRPRMEKICKCSNTELMGS